MASSVSFAHDIRPLFNEEDVTHMLGVDPTLNLSSYDSVRAHAEAIHNVLSFGAMPPGNPWPKSQVELFKQWMDAGYPP